VSFFVSVTRTNCCKNSGLISYTYEGYWVNIPLLNVTKIFSGRKMNRLTLLLTSFLLALLSACVQTIEPADTRHAQLAISSVRDMQIRYPQGSGFALSPKHLQEVSLKPKQVQKIYQLYSDAIVRYMQNQGYYYMPHNSQAKFHVEFAIALSDDLNDQVISDKFGVTPGLQEKDNLEKGSFLIAIKDAEIEQRVWRGAVQGFIQEDYTSAEREGRAGSIVEMVLAQFFK
jgi:hypothetical protein